MNQEQDMTAHRQAGAEAISARAMEMAKENDIVIEKCVWDIGDDLEHEHAHRLDLFTEKKTVRLYFPDLELTTWESDIRRKRTENRLSSAIAQLLSRPAAPTYSYR